MLMFSDLPQDVGRIVFELAAEAGNGPHALWLQSKCGHGGSSCAT